MSEEQEDIDIAQWIAGEKSRKEIETSENSKDLDVYADIVNEIDTWYLAPVDKEKGFDSVNSHAKKETKVVSFSSRWVLGIAASLTLFLASYLFFFLQNDRVQYSTGHGEIKSIELPDGSNVTLNTFSTLAYNKKAWDENRSLELEGEAYFEVVKGETFEVKISGTASVTVLGTRFSVRQRETYLAAECYEGSVSVDYERSGTKSLVLEKGTGFYSNDGEGSIANLEIDKPLWITGNSTSFKNASIGEVLSAISAQFGISFDTDEQIDLKQRFTGTFVHSDEEIALKMVCDPLNLKFTKVGTSKYSIKN